MSECIHKSHNVSVLLYHAVCPTKYRRAVVTDEVDVVLRRVCVDISNRYEITFLEIGTDQDRVHFLLQSVPMHSPRRSFRRSNALPPARYCGVCREILRRVPSVKAQLWGGAFWPWGGYYINTVGRNGTEDAIRYYVASQGREAEYRKFPAEPGPPASQLELF